jgi:hypothetical protein
MTKQNFKQRNIKGIAIAICLAATTLFAACGEDDPPPPPDNGADITAFTFEGIVGTATIDKDALTVTATAKATVNRASIVAAFTLSNGATATVNGTAQVSGTTANNFSNTVIYNVTSSDKRLTNIWKVTITPEAKKYFTYKEPVKASFIEYNGGAIDANKNKRYDTENGCVMLAYENKKMSSVSYLESDRSGWVVEYVGRGRIYEGVVQQNRKYGMGKGADNNVGALGRLVVERLQGI